MDTGLYGQQLNLMEQLRAATSLPHAQTQTAPFFQALAACRLPLESYVGLLRGLLAIHGVFEQAIGKSSHPGVAAVWRDGMRRVPLLERDLRFFEPRAVADLEEAVNRALELAGRVRLWSAERPVALLGCCYVLEGSTLGAQVLRPQVARAFLLKGEDGLAYLGGSGPEVHARWEQFKERMNALRLNSEERDAVLEAAREFFEGMKALYEALHPFQPESKKYLVTSINPEAGRHTIPAEPREVEAAMKAADRCREAFPYFEQRYGDRGRRFARSDAAWMATLGGYEPDQIRGQVRWLGGLLAARGMPTLLLEVQLDMLAEELSAAVPEKRFEYEKLSTAAAGLREGRRKHLSDDSLKALDKGLERMSAGTLLGVAVADELEGIEGAVEALHGWMSDAGRFPPEWIAAVETTLAEARRLAGGRE